MELLQKWEASEGLALRRPEVVLLLHRRTMAANTTIDGYTIGSDGAKKVTYNKKRFARISADKDKRGRVSKTPPRLFFLLFFSGVQHFINQGK